MSEETRMCRSRPRGRCYPPDTTGAFTSSDIVALNAMY